MAACCTLYGFGEQQSKSNIGTEGLAMTADGGFESPVSAAARRLEAAVERLRARLARRLSTPDSSELSAELAAAKVRERELEDAGVQASAALEKAIGEIRAALGERG
jgi:hypothetical protein